MKFFAAIIAVASAVTIRDTDMAAQITAFAEKLNIEIPEEVSQLQDNAAISEALVATATEAGKSEDEIAAALGMWINFAPSSWVI